MVRGWLIVVLRERPLGEVLGLNATEPEILRPSL
jgi:hypothetical protein